MRQITIFGISLGVFAVGGLVYIILQIAGVDSLKAGVWSQLLLVGGLIGWVATYALRVVKNKMTYHQQRQEYEAAYFKKRLEELTPEEQAKIFAEIEQEEQAQVEGSKF